jgi:propanol-preferring alcohol dehydrogenase
MKAQVLHELQPIEKNPLKFEDYPDPIPGDHEALVRIEACGVCHSNLHMIEGDWQPLGIPGKLPIIPGHEIVGIIEKIGRNSNHLKPGMRVGIQVLYDACGTCEFCLTGRENLCLTQLNTGENIDGGYAEFIKAPSQHVYPVPDNLTPEESAPLFCPGVTAYRAVKRAGITFDQTVVIFGIGGVGHLALQFAKLAGAEVIAVDANQNAITMAMELGADYAVLPDQLDDLLAKTGRPDVVSLHTPSQRAIEKALKIVKRGGNVMLATIGTPPPVNFNEEHNVLTSVVGTRTDMNHVLKIASKGRIKVKVKAYSLKEANEILRKLKNGQIAGRAVLKP